MNCGRIEQYTHSDMTTENKGIAVVQVYCQTDFAAKTDDFKIFCKYLARMSYAAFAGVQADSEEIIFFEYDMLLKEFPDIETFRLEVENKLKEKITVNQISVVVL